MTTQRWLGIFVLGLIVARLPVYAQEQPAVDASAAPTSYWLGVTSAGDTARFIVDAGRVQVRQFRFVGEGTECFPERETQDDQLSALLLQQSSDSDRPHLADGGFVFDRTETRYLKREGRFPWKFQPAKGTVEVSLRYRLVGRAESDTVMTGEWEFVADREEKRPAACPLQSKGTWRASKLGPVLEVPDPLYSVSLGLVTGQPRCSALDFTEHAVAWQWVDHSESLVVVEQQEFKVFPESANSVAIRIKFSRTPQASPYRTFSDVQVLFEGDAGGDVRSASCVETAVHLGVLVKDWEVVWFEREDGSPLKPGHYTVLVVYPPPEPLARLTFEILP
jgi:hypothetical protein